MSSKDNKNCRKPSTKKYIETFTNNDDNTTLEYIIKHKSKYYIQKEESDSESDSDLESESESESESEYIVKNKCKKYKHKKEFDTHKKEFDTHKKEFDSESDHNTKKKSKKCKQIKHHDSSSDSEYVIKNKSKHCKNNEDSDTELFEYFIKNKCYKKICNYYEIDLNLKKNNCNKDELNKNSIALFKNMLNKYSNGRIIIFFQEEK